LSAAGIERPIIAAFMRGEDILFFTGQHGVSAIQSADRSDARDPGSATLVHVVGTLISFLGN
jgi:hypothetical protein